MPRDFETHWKKNSENYKHGWKFEPFQVNGNIAGHHEKTKQDRIDESNLQILPAKQKDKKKLKHNWLNAKSATLEQTGLTSATYIAFTLTKISVSIYKYVILLLICTDFTTVAVIMAWHMMNPFHESHSRNCQNRLGSGWELMIKWYPSIIINRKAFIVSKIANSSSYRDLYFIVPN